MTHPINYENLIVILYLFNRTKLEGGRMKTAKLLYLFEDDLYNNKMIGSTYIMKRYQMGPYNRNIADDLDNLAKNGFLKTREIYYDVIDNFANIYYRNYHTQKFLKSIEELFEENSKIFDKLDIIADIYGRRSGEQLKKRIYSLPKTGSKNQRITQYNPQETIINPKKVTNPDTIFQLDEDWYDTIEVLLNPEIYYGIQRGIKDAQQGKFSNELN